ncbi:hypothetical protein BH11ACT5_BH11ACT5_11540 [soil metagenome]
MTPTVSSRRSYIALWIVDLLLLAVGAVLAGIQSVSVTPSEPDAFGNYLSTAVFVGGWGAGLLGLGIVTLIVLLFLNAFSGGPLFIREREEPDNSDPA